MKGSDFGFGRGRERRGCKSLDITSGRSQNPPDNGEFLQVRNALFAIEKKARDPATLDLVKDNE
jgi:hypothetical protein